MARKLLGPEREQAFADGQAPLLALGLETQTANLLSAERAPGYLNIIYALLLLRRGHELEPLHDDLFERVVGPQRVREPAYELDQFARDIEQLCHWHAVERITEAHKLRGYRDNRRQRFRYRLHGDAIALVEWLEARLAARLDGRGHDGRDRLADVVGALKELRRLLEQWRQRASQRGSGPDHGLGQDPGSGPDHGLGRAVQAHEADVDLARRAIYLLESVSDAAAEISEELLSFRAEMLAFASRPYDLAVLQQILQWLERYVDVYLARLDELRTEIRDRLAALGQPRFRQALAECRDALEAERMATPRLFRRLTPLTTPDELTEAPLRFFARDGRMGALCEHIDDSARAVVLKMHRHLAELERRNHRRAELRACIRHIARRAEPPEPALATLLNRLLASAHGRFSGRAAQDAGQRGRPPVPRASPPRGRSPAADRPLRRKSLSPDAARELSARHHHDLGVWLRQHVRAAQGEGSVLLSLLALDEPGAPRRWMDVARARHLAGGRAGARLGVTFEVAPGRACIRHDQEALDAPDCRIACASAPGSRRPGHGSGGRAGWSDAAGPKGSEERG